MLLSNALEQHVGIEYSRKTTRAIGATPREAGCRDCYSVRNILASRGEALESPINGQRAVFRKTAQGTGAELLLLDFFMAPGRFLGITIPCRTSEKG